MGARVSRVFRNFNVESRAHREIGRIKAVPAPRHRAPADHDDRGVAAARVNEIHKKDDPLLSRLKDVYVQSTDPHTQASEGRRKVVDQVERRAVSPYAVKAPPGVSHVTDVPKGKLTLVEALMVLNNSKQSPGTWSAERIAQELSLAPDDARALVTYFIPFNIKLLPSKKDTQRITDS